MIRAATSLILLLLTTPIGDEAVEVKDFGTVDLATYECRDIRRSTVIQRVCYDPAQRALLVGLAGQYDRYCEFPQQAFVSFVTAPSMGQFFQQNIGGSQTEGRYACRTHRRLKH